jgi:FkbM family methyltransferase
LFRPLSSEDLEEAIKGLTRFYRLDLLDVAHKAMGIGISYHFPHSGERFMLQNILPKYIRHPEPTFFDVGANVGDYSKELSLQFPKSTIYAFEPNQETFAVAQKNLVSSNVHCYHLGLGAEPSQATIYTYAEEKISGHASLYKDVFLDLHKSTVLEQMNFQITTLDDFCAAHEINYIDFMKIDTEGHELEVLKGGSRMLREQRLGIIQFEFNSMHVISRAFLRDFYRLLDSYEMYRLDTDRLIPLFEYDTANEIFKYQNWLAISKSLSTGGGE